MKIHQFVHTLTVGDAISDEARSISRLLRAEGIQSEIYSAHWHGKYDGEVRSYKQFEDDLNAENGAPVAIVLHYSIGSPLNTLYLSHPGVKRAVIYHNLTPDRWFQGYNPRVTSDLTRGKDELPQIVNAADLCLADSGYNEKDLLALGAKRSHVLPLLVDLAKWSVPANAGIAGAVRGRASVNVVHVGRFAPNKCIEDIIRAFYFYHHKIEQKSHLWLIGSEVDTEIYSFELRNLVRELRLQDAVSFPGSLADSEVKAVYENADLYLCMSEHEGFCVPLIEAMYFSVPVIAFDSSAVGETLGDGGLLVGRKSPAELAELMAVVMSDGGLREKLKQQGRNRVQKFSEETFRQHLRTRLIEPLFSA